MIQPKYNKQNGTIFLGFDSIEINLVISGPAEHPVFPLIFLILYGINGVCAKFQTFLI